MKLTWADRFRWWWRIVNRMEALEVRFLGTSGVALMRRTPVLVIETTGRRSGKRRRTPVTYWREGDDFLVGGGAAGMTRVDWVANLRARPDAVLWVRRRPVPVRAEELHGAEYEAARAKAMATWPGAARYERSGRPIPYFRLTPVP